MSKKLNGPWIGTVVVLVSLLGCAHEYAETDGYGATPEWANQPTPGPSPSQVAITTTPPRAVYVLSIRPEQFTGADGRSESLLHLRVAVESPSDATAGNFDPQETVVKFDGGRLVFATHPKDQSPGAPVTINRGPQGDFDVYFPMATPEASVSRERVTTRRPRAAVSMLRSSVLRAGRLFPSDF